MVSGGLCQEACRFPRHHRYCNQFPLDSHLVRGVPKVPYINASRMKLLGWKQVRGDLSDTKKISVLMHNKVKYVKLFIMK